MPTITYIEHSGEAHKIHVENGKSVMQGAVDNLVEELLVSVAAVVVALLATFIVDAAWYAKTAGPNETETEMLDAVPEPTPTSRLSCQITVSDELDGLLVRMPEEQF